MTLKFVTYILRAYLPMIWRGMMLRVVISKIILAFVPKYFYFFLHFFISKPMETHVPGFRPLLVDVL